MMIERLLIIGNGMASVRFVETLVRLAPGRFSLTVVGAEPQAGYNRVLLSALLARDVTEDDVILRDRAWYEANDVQLISSDAVVSLDRQNGKAILASGTQVSFDRCVFATGSHPIKLPVPGMNMEGVITFRDLPDVLAMEQAAVSGQKVAVIGGGLLGIEAAYGLAKCGADVTLVHVMDKLMERQLDDHAAKLVAKALAHKGVKVLLERQTVAVTGEDRATGLAFTDGTEIRADLVVCAVGIRPNSDLARSTGLSVQRGIVIDDHMCTSFPGFYAIGECAEHRGVAYGLVEPAYAQAEALARSLAGKSTIFEGMVLATNLKVSGLPVFSAGAYLGGEGLTQAVLKDTQTGRYKKLVFDGSKLVGCVLVSDTDDALWYLDLIRRGVDIMPARSLLIHGRSFAEPALNPSLHQAA
jgi:nitrite reductase (NADH) large subunit